AAGNRPVSAGNRPVSWPTEDSPSGLGRTLGKRVGGNPSRVRISYPPPARPGVVRTAPPPVSRWPEGPSRRRATATLHDPTSHLPSRSEYRAEPHPAMQSQTRPSRAKPGRAEPRQHTQSRSEREPVAEG